MPQDCSHTSTQSKAPSSCAPGNATEVGETGLQSGRQGSAPASSLPQLRPGGVPPTCTLPTYTSWLPSAALLSNLEAAGAVPASPPTGLSNWAEPLLVRGAGECWRDDQSPAAGPPTSACICPGGEQLCTASVCPSASLSWGLEAAGVPQRVHALDWLPEPRYSSARQGRAGRQVPLSPSET